MKVKSVLNYIDDRHEVETLLDMCHDMNSGMSYRNGEKWHIDACTSCSCVSGRALCVAATCPVTCLNPVHVEGKCCPVCNSEVDDGIIKYSSSSFLPLIEKPAIT